MLEKGGSCLQLFVSFWLQFKSCLQRRRWPLKVWLIDTQKESCEAKDRRLIKGHCIAMKTLLQLNSVRPRLNEKNEKAEKWSILSHLSQKLENGHCLRQTLLLLFYSKLLTGPLAFRSVHFLVIKIQRTLRRSISCSPTFSQESFSSRVFQDDYQVDTWKPFTLHKNTNGESRTLLQPTCTCFVSVSPPVIIIQILAFRKPI